MLIDDSPRNRAVTKALIGGGQLISKEIRRAEREYMNIPPPPPLTL